MSQMIHSLNKHYTLFIALGATITLLASVIALTEGGQIDQVGFGGSGVAIWLPAFRLMGITLVLGGVVMAADVLCALLTTVRSKVADLALHCMFTSLLLVTAGFIASLYLAGTMTDGAEAVSTVIAAPAVTWLEGLRLVSSALMFLAVGFGMHTLSQLIRRRQAGTRPAEVRQSPG